MRVGFVVMPSRIPMSTKVLMEGMLAVSRKIFTAASPGSDISARSLRYVLCGETVLDHQLFVFAGLSESVADPYPRNWNRVGLSYRFCNCASEASDDTLL